MCFAALGFAISTAAMFIATPEFEIKKYHFWWQVLASFGLTGIVFHLTAETTGLNAWFHARRVAAKMVSTRTSYPGSTIIRPPLFARVGLAPSGRASAIALGSISGWATHS